jgi:diguanylate cyclase (GGDEF)-like protein
MHGSTQSSLATRLWRSDPDFHQALARAAIVAGALWFAFSSFYEAHAPDPSAITLGRAAALVAAAVAVSMLLSILRWPGPMVARRVIGIVHDACATSMALYLGGEATACFAVVYVVIILASGVRFGTGYLGFAALCSLALFGAVYALGPYWRTNHALSLNTVLVLTVVPAYMYRLIRHREQARVDLERRASHDSLTGLMNRAGFEQQLDHLVVPGRADQVLIYIDLDRFKAVNDAGGHAAGDQLLVEIARVVRDCVRDEDTCARIGGDEFCVFLCNCPLDLARQIATRIRERIRDYRVSWNGRQHAVGASIGVVSSRSIDGGSSLLRLADAACYAAKNAGRDTVHVVDTARTQVDTGELRALNLPE